MARRQTVTLSDEIRISDLARPELSAAQKAALAYAATLQIDLTPDSILQEARQTGQTVSEVCRRHQIQPTQFYAWEKQARSGALWALRGSGPGRPKQDPTAAQQAEIERLRAAVADLTIENLSLKKGVWR